MQLYMGNCSCRCMEEGKCPLPPHKTCPIWLRNAYRRAVEYICEQCHKHEDKVGLLIPHRIKRANMGGDYRPGNVKLVCSKCHKIIHYNEFK